MAGFRIELNKASALNSGGQLGQAKFAGSGVRDSPGHATRFDQKSRPLTTASSLGLTLRVRLVRDVSSYSGKRRDRDAKRPR